MPAPVVHVNHLPPPRVVVEQPVPPPTTVAVIGAPITAGYYGGTMQVNGMPTQVVVQPVAPVMQVSAEAYPPPQQVMVAGATRVRRALEERGVEVHDYDGSELSHKGDGGPTCLTAPLLRRE